MKRTNMLIFILLIIISILVLTIYLQKTVPPEQPKLTSPTPATEEPPKQPIVHYPVPIPSAQDEQSEKVVAEEQPEVSQLELSFPEQLPPVQESDETIQQALENLHIKKSLFSLILMENFIQKLVVTVDNLTEKRLPQAHLPLRKPLGRFITSGTEEAPQTSTRNHPRYTKYVQLLEVIDVDLASKIYVYFYSLFQSAYVQLGYQNAYFNDRLVYVIEHLLETPNPAEPILLAQPSVFYTYADPTLEQLSSGQKILLRIGPEHRAKVMKILRSYRQKLIKLHP
ncbi:MAG: DUF3014 domain-containing protein [Desulfuromonadales bacterium]|nr:DUF3014 domain-containing protein [Desulfuromonadales bacterium]